MLALSSDNSTDNMYLQYLNNNIVFSTETIDSDTTLENSIALGPQSSFSANNAIALSGKALDLGSVAVGGQAQDEGSVAIGFDSSTTNNFSVAIG